MKVWMIHSAERERSILYKLIFVSQVTHEFNPTFYGLLIPADGRGVGGNHPPLLNYFLMVEFAVFYDTTLCIWIAPSKIQKMRVLVNKLWIL